MKILLSILSTFVVVATAQAQTDIVPKPVSQTPREGVFVLTAKTVPAALYGHAELLDYYHMRAGELKEFLPDSVGGNIISMIVLSETEMPAEGYELRIEPDRILIEAGDRNGAIYGIETLMQLINPDRHIAKGEVAAIEIPCQTIVDHPRFPYRGMHLDIARTFSDKATVMRYIDNMARHKLNRLHWHLVDDEGWRIEIKSYPRLTEIGAWRGGGLPVKHVYGAWDKKYGGYFTQNDIREVVEYAAFRGVEIIPEIDLPGHSRAAAKAYPEILCGGPYDTIPSKDDRRNVWCATREENFEMLDKILGEVAALFPSEYIHVGGDEVESAQWRSCPTCGPLVKKYSPAWLTGQFMNRLNGILAGHGKKHAVWNEAMNGGNLVKDAVVYGWENVEVCRKALQAGYRTVLMPSQYFYFDMRQREGEPGMYWAGTVTLEKTYSFEPVAVGITDAEMKNVVGVEGAFWAEVFLAHSPEFLDYQTYPRICALSEVAWTPRENRNWTDFSNRMNRSHYRRLADWGIAFRLDPPVERREGDRITLSHPVADVLIYSTTDGTEPGLDAFAGHNVNINMADEVNRERVFRFKARLERAQSPTVYLKDYREPVIKPKYKLTSSLTPRKKFPFSYAQDNNSSTHMRTTTTNDPGDWFLWTFSVPVDASAITVKTGSNHMGRYVVPSGYVEVSYDGKTFEVIEPEFHVEAVIRPKSGLRAIRLTVTSENNGEDSVIIQDLKVVKTVLP